MWLLQTCCLKIWKNMKTGRPFLTQYSELCVSFVLFLTCALNQTDHSQTLELSDLPTWHATIKIKPILGNINHILWGKIWLLQRHIKHLIMEERTHCDGFSSPQQKSCRCIINQMSHLFFLRTRWITYTYTSSGMFARSWITWRFRYLKQLFRHFSFASVLGRPCSRQM